ncbi:MAG TPA: CBS domain-containing protein [Streptosporangiaceae bacterium]|nr:CBS domain-containing protein [Streptosporangiaceae bacterium]
MPISDILRVKGTHVVTVTPDTKVRRLLAVLAEHGIGAVVVSHDGTSVDGIVSERDIVRALALRGAAVMSEPVTAIYTAEVYTVTPQTPLEEIMRLMTEHRMRHAPVVVSGRLLGIVSIGDVVKNRIDELETERTALTDYITGTRLPGDRGSFAEAEGSPGGPGRGATWEETQALMSGTGPTFVVCTNHPAGTTSPLRWRAMMVSFPTPLPSRWRPTRRPGADPPASSART